MPGERDLARLLAGLDVERLPGRWTVVHGDVDELRAVAAATVREPEGWSHVVPVEVALALGFDVDFEAVWLTVTAHSALEAVGLTAAIAGALAESDIACNVLAGYFHDHLLVPAARVDDAVEVLAALREH